MTAQGYADGRSWTFDERYAEGRFERLAPLAQELLALAPDVLLVSTTPANLVAKQATRTVPIEGWLPPRSEYQHRACPLSRVRRAGPLRGSWWLAQNLAVQSSVAGPRP
jgi:hypothetical protein